MRVLDRFRPTAMVATRRIARQLIAGLVVVFLLFGPYLSQFLRVGPHLQDMLKGRNALWFLWQPGDVFILLGLMLGLATTAVAVREALRRWAGSLPLRVFDHLFVIALGAGVLANVWFHTQQPAGYHISQFGMEMRTGWLLLVGITAYSLASTRSRLVRWCTRACQVVSPAVLIVACQLLCLPTLAQRMDSLENHGPSSKPKVIPAADAEPQPSVYLCIFDEWSYRQTYEAGQVRSDLPHLAELSREATSFHNAHSPGTKTVTSIPAILRGTDDVAELAGPKPGFMKKGEFVPGSQYPSIFSRAGCGKYRKIMTQWGFAVSLWVADELDVSRTYSCYARGEGWFDQAGLHLYNAAFFWTDPWTIFAYEKLKPRVEDAYILRMYAQMHEDVVSIIRERSGPTFAIVHYPLPHPPYLLDERGNYCGRDPHARISSNADGYKRNLACVDRLVGEIVSELKQANRFADSLLVLTSDHSWRADPAVPDRNDDELTHVPLIVKLPGQTEPTQVDEDFRTCRLGELIGRALRDPPRTRSLAQRPRW